MHGVRAVPGEDEPVADIQPVLPLRQRRPRQVPQDEGGLRHGAGMRFNCCSIANS